jgi:hypothetical protein
MNPSEKKNQFGYRPPDHDRAQARTRRFTFQLSYEGDFYHA